MKIAMVIAFMAGLLALTVDADSPAPERPRATTSQSGRIVFTMIPAKWDFRDGKRVQACDPFGICYSLTDEGKLVEKWKVSGWYSFEVFLSEDGRYLIRMGPWNRGRKPKADDLAVAFYQDGKLLKKYSTADLVRRPEAILASTSHYEWLARARSAIRGEIDPDAELRLDGDKVFHLKTCDLIKYQFDVTTGKIISANDPLEKLKKAE